jgi:CheY-like chemotaxis protein
MLQPIKILLADNDEDDRELIGEALNAIGIEDKYTYVESGFNVLQYLEAIHSENEFPALIVLDLVMPILSGLDTLKILKADKRYRDIPVIIFSGSDNEHDILDVLNAGAAAYFKKPPEFSAYESIARKLYGYSTTGMSNAIS